MPATSGRVRMPHNNRMSTSASLKSSDIWSKTIGHDPYATQAEVATQKNNDQPSSSATAEKVKNVMDMARNQNVTDGSNREGFTAQLYLGLKRGKVRRNDASNQQQSSMVDPKLQELLEGPDSSSEEEFVEVQQHQEEKRQHATKKKEKKSRKSKKRKKRKHSSDEDSSSSSSDSDSDSEEDRKRRKRRREKRKRSKKKKYANRSGRVDHSDDIDSNSDSAAKKRRKSSHRRHKESKKKSRSIEHTSDADSD